MESQVCVNCLNEKTVNSTTNRLVTESCGHIKCMDCLLHEKNGCLACLSAKNRETNEDDLISEEKHSDENEPIQEEDKHVSVVSKPSTEAPVYDLSKKRKPETSHIKIETDANGRCYVCTLCDKKFHARSQVHYHAYCNGQRKPHQCLECYKSFATLSHYKYHMQVHRNERTYKCDTCGDSFFQKSKLQRHKQTKHTMEKNYVCSTCSKAFNNLTSLRKHGLTHTEERPYTCTVCARTFRDSSNYRKHVLKHNEPEKCVCGSCGAGGAGGARCGGGGGRCGARRHQCPRCPQAFHSSKDMRRHAAVHTDTKPFRCKVCKRRFRRKDNLERHIRNTHPAFSTSSAVECDETALKEITTNEKTKLESLNPLPPLPQEVIHQHMHGTQEDVPTIDKSHILVANNARQSVIVGKWTAKVEKAPATPPECEYVHKIRKANSMASHNNIPLPPIDENKMLELNKKGSLDAFEVGAPPKDKKKVYEMIMYDDVKREGDADSALDPPDSHWKRRKMKLNINW